MIGGDAIPQNCQGAGPKNVAKGLTVDLGRHANKVRGVLNVGTLRLPCIGLTGHGHNLLPAIGAGEGHR